MFLFYLFPVTKRFKRGQEPRNSKAYHLFSHIFLPPFACIIIITLTGPYGPCVICIITVQNNNNKKMFMEGRRVGSMQSLIVKVAYFKSIFELAGRNYFQS